MNRKFYFIIYLALLLLVITFMVFSDFGLLKRIELESEKNELLESKSKEIMIRDSLKSAKMKLESDFSEIERIAREYYGYIIPGETVYIISNSK